MKNDRFNLILGRLVAFLRSEKLITQADFSKKLNLSTTSLSAKENGKDFSVSEFMMIVDVLNIDSVDNLISDINRIHDALCVSFDQIGGWDGFIEKFKKPTLVKSINNSIYDYLR